MIEERLTTIAQSDDKGLQDIKEGKTVSQKEVQNKASEICSK